MMIGYARVSSLPQLAGYEAQIAALTAAGCERIYQEQVSAISERDEFNRLMDNLREGDTLVVTKLDRLARSVFHLIQIIQELENKKAVLKVLEMSLDTSTATGKLTANIIGAVAQFEREMMLERQREGIARAKAAGKYRGRKPTVKEQSEKIREMRERGIGATAIAKELGIGRASVYRVLN